MMIPGGFTHHFLLPKNQVMQIVNSYTDIETCFSMMTLMGVIFFFRHMRDISIMLLQMKEWHLPAWSERCIIVEHKLNACDQAAYAYTF